MVGFTATCDDDGILQNPDDELEDVAWFTADALPPVPPGYSIARALIDDFAQRRGVDPATVPTWQRRKATNTDPPARPPLIKPETP